MVSCVRKGLTLYFNPMSPCCRSVLLCLSELGLGAEMCRIDYLSKKEQLKPSFLKINPHHTIPTIVDDNFVLWESRAINSYLVNRYGCIYKDRLNPSEPKQRAVMERILQFDLATLYPSIETYFTPQLNGQRADKKKGAVLERSLALLDKHFYENRYAASQREVTLADFSLLGSLSTLDAYQYSYHHHNNISAWSNRLKKELPYYKDVMKEGVILSRAWASSRFIQKKKKEDKKYCF